MPAITRFKASRAKIATTNAVFDTAELLEMIFIQLSMKDLLLNTRVCKQWKTAITTSLKLQRRLFMAPEPITHAFKHDHNAWEIEEIATVAMPCLNDTSVVGYHGLRTSGPWILATLNPLLTETMHERILMHHVAFGSRGRYFETVAIEGGCVSPNPATIQSWRQIYLTQPPAQAVSLYVPRPPQTPGRYRKVVVENPSGVMTGDILEAMDHLKQELLNKRDVKHFPCVFIFLEQMMVISGEGEKDNFRRFASCTRNRGATGPPLNATVWYDWATTNLLQEWEQIEQA